MSPILDEVCEGHIPENLQGHVRVRYQEVFER